MSASHQALDRVLPAGSTSKPEIRFPTVQFGRASNVPQARSQDNYIVTNATSINFVAKGTHDLKFGFEMNKVPTTSTINQSFNGLFEFLQDRPVIAGDPTSLPFRYTQGVELRGELAALTRDVDIYSAFINNQWQPRSNLTVNLGVRYDWQFWKGDLNGQDVPDDVPIEQFWVRQITGDLRGQNFKAAPNDLNNIAPRLGLTWDPMSNGAHGASAAATASTTTRSTRPRCAASWPGIPASSPRSSPTTRGRALGSRTTSSRTCRRARSRSRSARRSASPARMRKRPMRTR